MDKLKHINMYNWFILLYGARIHFFDFFLFFYDILFFYIVKLRAALLHLWAYRENYAMKWKKWQEKQDRATIL